MSRIGEILDEVPSGPAAQGPVRKSLWPSLYPKLLDLIRKHRTTLVFVNNRRLAERIASAINEIAGQEIMRSHHGSVSREQRLQIEDDLKAGRIPAIVATSSLELGIDMGSIDLVVQIEATPSVTSALQRIGRAGHQASATSKGVLFPKFRGDLASCAALTKLMVNGEVEETRYLRNPLDILAQQIVAMASVETWKVDDLEKTIRQSAPFADLTRNMLESVLEMLSGRFPSDDFAELRPRIVWDRIAGTVRARQGAKQIAITNGGTIPDRGLYGVFLAGADPGKGRVGELDEEMVFETREGETFLLGATTWRVEDISHDRVVVSPAPGEPGKMPFWKGEGNGRSAEFGRAVGSLVRTLKKLPEEAAETKLMQEHRMDDWAAQNLIAYLREQQQKAGAVPDDKTIVVERYSDELGDWRICLLSPYGARVHAPWAHAIEAIIRHNTGADAETMWSDDGIVIRLPETEEPPSIELFIPDPDEVESLVVQQIGSSALFASRFREAAARALLLPRRYPGQRSPLWQQRKKAADLLHVTSKFQNFPIILETYRELLKDYFDMPGLVKLLRDIRSRTIQLTTVNTRTPSPFASSLMFGYVGNFIYEGDAPLAERRAQALSIDQAQLRELLGEAEFRELLDADAIQTYELQLQHLDPAHQAKHADALHEMLMRLGDLSKYELFARSNASDDEVKRWIQELQHTRRIIEIPVAGERRWIAAEDAARFRDALGVPLPQGLPDAFLQPTATPLSDLIARYARTHGPFHLEEVAKRFGLGASAVLMVLQGLEGNNKVVQGEFRPGGSGTEWSDTNVLRTLRLKSLAKLRKQVEPVEPSAYARFLPVWHGVGSSRKGSEALLEAIEQIQGYPVPVSVLERQILPARIRDYDPRDLDALLSSGLVVWTGVEPLGQNDGRIALYLTEHASQLVRPSTEIENLDPLHSAIRETLGSSGAVFFPQILAATGNAFKVDVLRALWDLVWAGEITNDTLLPVRAILNAGKKKRRVQRLGIPVARTSVPPAGAGRWSLVRNIMMSSPNTERMAALSHQLLNRLGIVTREGVAAEKIAGGFSAVYPVMKLMEESGKIRRGYFIAGRGAAQFASAGALDRLRDFREPDAEFTVVMLAAADPANPYGAVLPWPERSDTLQPSRSAGAQVIMVDGNLAAYLGKGERNLLTFPDETQLDRQASGIARALANEVESGKRRAILISFVDGKPPSETFLALALQKEGFVHFTHGWQKRAEPKE
jgi:ATP-dependent Lhr-like helicase